MSDDLTSRLPSEICHCIFALVLYSGFTDFWSFWALRKKILLSATWFRFVACTPDFWSEIMLSPRMSPLAVSTYIRRSMDRPLHVHVSFRRSDLLLYQAKKQNTSPTSVLMASMLNLIIHTSSRWMSLRIETDHTNASSTLRRAFRHLRLPDLRELSFVFFHSTDVTDVRIDLPLWPIHWLDGTFARIEVLSLRAVSLEWHDLPPLPCLKHLSLCMLPPGSEPTFAQYKQIIEGSFALEYIALHSVGSLGAPPKGAFIRSDSVIALDLRFGSKWGYDWLVETFDMPQLTRVGLYVATEDDIVQAAACRDLLSNATILRVRGPPSDGLLYDDLFDIFPNVACLDLSQADPTVFRGLLDASRDRQVHGRTTVLPNLETLVLISAARPYLKDFIQLHSANDNFSFTALTLRRMILGFVITSQCTKTPAKLSDGPYQSRTFFGAFSTIHPLFCSICRK
ncbi:hypothetical protein B0H11DRAFT_2250688 [Mycena galericulata]|nr:hypothetical protein B0H11DRAFT_2254768 [Mycena galericulata]KAJ7443513.1 hypothetical protein B0H11DRAFT_2250688 [Mycena galericulata]